MVSREPVQALDTAFATSLTLRKRDVVAVGDGAHRIVQHGMAAIECGDWPGWPPGLRADEPTIETFVVSTDLVTAMSDNQPFVDAWFPLATWLNRTIREALSSHQVTVDGDAYVTASLTDVALLEGLAHMDDDTFTPTDSVGVVAIIGEHMGPRVATGALEHSPLRPMSQINYPQTTLDDFGADRLDHCFSRGDQLVIFPQFGQLHAGPASHHIDAATRQLLVFRARVQTVG